MGALKAEDAFFVQDELTAVSDATTSHGLLWHAAPPRWGHSMHSMCSYQGMFPARLPHYFIQAFSAEGDSVLDPFSGRGTVVLQARMEGRAAKGVDLNPLAYVLSAAKANPPSWTVLMKRLSDLQRDERNARPGFQAPSEIQMLFSNSVLKQIEYLRDAVAFKPWSRWNASDFVIAGALLGILHGRARRDGSSAYLSISMPNTFSMAPGYVRRFIDTNGLVPPNVNVFDLLRAKLARIYADDIEGARASVVQSDALSALQSQTRARSVDLVVTSPPYLRVVNYGTSNWIRLWWLGIEEVSRDGGAGRRALDEILDHQHREEQYLEFMRGVFGGVARVLKRDGMAAIVIGDVAEPGEEPLNLARMAWDKVGKWTGLRLVEEIEDRMDASSKVSRIWGATRGNATEVERVLLLQRVESKRRLLLPPVEWEEPYKDAGPDEAHEIAASRRRHRPSPGSQESRSGRGG